LFTGLERHLDRLADEPADLIVGQAGEYGDVKQF
jgi:hypothetical protein